MRRESRDSSLEGEIGAENSSLDYSKDLMVVHIISKVRIVLLLKCIDVLMLFWMVMFLMLWMAHSLFFVVFLSERTFGDGILTLKVGISRLEFRITPPSLL